MTAGSWRYFEGEIAQGRENYYIAAGEEPGRWVGAGAHTTSLKGEVDAQGLERLFDQGAHPISGEALGRRFQRFKNRDTVTGYSLSFSPPKSVSLLWGLGDGTTSSAVRAAHDQAVGAAVSFLEQHACFARTGKAGVFQIETTGLVAAAFVHRTSRALDPQLHTHLLVANKVQGLDGGWRAIDGRELFTMQKPAGMVYNAALLAELTRRLGVRFDPVDRNGQADIAGVPSELIDRFSARRAQVLADGHQRIAQREWLLRRVLNDSERAEQFQWAAFDHRPSKAAVGETDSQLRDRWNDQARHAGHEAVSWLPKTVHRLAAKPPATVRVDPNVVHDVVAAVMEEYSVFGRAEIAKHLAPLTPPALSDADAALEWVEQATAAVLAHPEIVTLSCPLLSDTPETLGRGDGLAMIERHGQRRWTTCTSLGREAKVTSLAHSGKGAGLAVVEPHRTALAIAAAGLSADQATAVGRLLCGGDQLACLVGPAGTGKTRAMLAAAQAWGTAGHRVFGVAVAARAAEVLEDETSICSDTLARFLRRCEHNVLKLRPGDVIVVDEAGMVTTADLSRLADLAVDSGAKLTLVGDDHQLAPVGAGGLFRLLVEETGAATLSEVRRFSKPWEREASLRLRAGDPTVIDVYERHGRVLGGSREPTLDAALDAWKRAHDDGDSAIVLAPDHATVDQLAQRARAMRVAAGAVRPTGIIAGGQIIGVGDEVVTVSNDRRLVTTTGHWVRNGDRWTVTNHTPDGAITVASTSGHGSALLPADYSADNVRLGYALTIQKAQGVTVDRSILVGDDRLTAELVYVAMTRGRHTNTAFIALDTSRRAHSRPPNNPRGGPGDCSATPRRRGVRHPHPAPPARAGGEPRRPVPAVAPSQRPHHRPRRPRPPSGHRRAATTSRAPRRPGAQNPSLAGRACQPRAGTDRRQRPPGRTAAHRSGRPQPPLLAATPQKGDRRGPTRVLRPQRAVQPSSTDKASSTTSCDASPTNATSPPAPSTTSTTPRAPKGRGTHGWQRTASKSPGATNSAPASRPASANSAATRSTPSQPTSSNCSAVPGSTSTPPRGNAPQAASRPTGNGGNSSPTSSPLVTSPRECKLSTGASSRLNFQP
jgi:conjugative relaxase-like TrwC/TraI family protein